MVWYVKIEQPLQASYLPTLEELEERTGAFVHSVVRHDDARGAVHEGGSAPALLLGSEEALRESLRTWEQALRETQAHVSYTSNEAAGGGSKRHRLLPPHGAEP